MAVLMVFHTCTLNGWLMHESRVNSYERWHSRFPLSFCPVFFFFFLNSFISIPFFLWGHWMEELSSTWEAMWREKRGGFHGTPFLEWAMGWNMYRTRIRGEFFPFKTCMELFNNSTWTRVGCLLGRRWAKKKGAKSRQHHQVCVHK